MQKIFPPGDIYNRKTRSNWREFEFMLHQVQNAIQPDVSLRKTVDHWQEICRDLAENNRQRKPQMTNYKFS